MSLYESVPISSVWAKLESTYGNIVSLYLKDLLIECAYDSFQSLFNIVAGSICPMELDLNNNPRATQRYCDKFKVKHDSFKFKPAHRDIILSIPRICEDMKKEMDKMANSTKSSSAPQERKTSVQPGGSNQGTTTSQSLKRLLVKKVRSCAQVLGLKLNVSSISEHNIAGFKRSAGVDQPYRYSCYFTCPLCGKRYMANYKNSWDTSNIRKHFVRNHHNEGPKPTAESASLDDDLTAMLKILSQPDIVLSTVT